MRRFVSDTQCVIWHFTDEQRRMPKAARSAFQAAEAGTAQILVPTMVLAEAIFLAERRRVPGSIVQQLLALPDTPTASLRVVSFDLDMVRAMADFGPSAVPELADRIIAATARALNLPLLTTDPEIAASGLVQVAT